jgi:GTP-binding protein
MCSMHDRARIHVRAGAGGDGRTSFRREAHVPRGGPDGGDGGRGGAVLLRCDDSLRDLQRLASRTHYTAARGGSGAGALRHGANGEDLVLSVPPGTVITAPEDSGELAGRRWELLGAGQVARVARGGAGGRGNKHFATATRQAPRFSERGLAGEEGWLELRLKLLADVGLVGMPNAGKSSLLSRLTRAVPKVADYPFTTLSPVLGVLEGEERQLVVADIPGLIEGASQGAGLGGDFLAHVERTRLLVHVLDLAPELSAGEGADPRVNHATIERELAAHDERLAELPRVLALSKADLVSAEQVGEAVAEWERRLGPDVAVIATSSATGAGIKELARELLRSVGPALAVSTEAPSAAPASGLGPPLDGALQAEPGGAGAGGAGEEELAEHMVFRPAAQTGFSVRRLGPRSFAVSGRGIERLVARYDVENADALAYVEERLRRIGVLRALEEEGFRPGDQIEIGGVSLELDPGARA